MIIDKTISIRQTATSTAVSKINAYRLLIKERFKSYHYQNHQVEFNDTERISFCETLMKIVAQKCYCIILY